ncbi:Protein IRX15-LIKE [Hibiscus syriacus]|uniref:Protein IRX15-LIKE n=1 Tax=Hibiscus syriacus TaxID=106335 RepID=A0A6A3ABV6_HIBSY|nr:Protein IRX15-LIKE [Hibiscus syriacus]
MKNGNSNTKLILLHPYIQKQGRSNRLWLLAFVSFFTVAFLLMVIYATESITSKTAAAAQPWQALLASLLGALSSVPISDVLRKCSSPCNFLVFGLTQETLLWKALNHNGRTVFIDENRYYAAYYEELHPEIDAFNVQYMTKISETGELIVLAKEQIRNEYGPRGNGPDTSGRMQPMFTSGVLARSKKGGNPKTHIFVHDYYRDVEKMCWDEFLCKENMVEYTDTLAHFVVERMEENIFEYCRKKNNNTLTTDS